MAKFFIIFKKRDSLDRENYISVSILSHMSKVLERLIYKQIDDYVDDKFSLHLSDFRKNYNT